MTLSDEHHYDRSKFPFDPFGSPEKERAFWHSKTPQERIEAMELMRQIAYGYDPETTRMEKIFEIVKREDC